MRRAGATDAEMLSHPGLGQALAFDQTTIGDVERKSVARTLIKPGCCTPHHNVLPLIGRIALAIRDCADE
ncbi:hypothetical protein DEA98_27530 [Brucella pseudogrignonensis]|nr:hypothetical protein [Brucella pseudogrignonensis]